MRDSNDLNIISRRNLLHYAGAGAAALTLASLINIPFAEAKKMPNGADNFYTSDKVDLQKVTFDTGSVSFRGKLRSGQASDYPRLYQTAEIKSRSAATRWTWMTRRRASEMVWLMKLAGRRKLRISSKARQKR